MRVWGIKNCNSVRNALNFLDSRRICYEFIDYKKSPPQKELLKEWVKKVGMDIVLNAKSATYKKMQIADRALSDEEKLTLMMEHPTLIKRPILEYGDELEFGFDKDRYEKIF